MNEQQRFLVVVTLALIMGLLLGFAGGYLSFGVGLEQQCASDINYLNSVLDRCCVSLKTNLSIDSSMEVINWT